MCGIGGIYHLNEMPEKWHFLLSNFLKDIKYRGPDEEGFFSELHISMGVRRLKVIDLNTGNQPISNEDGSIHIVFNGEIYRFESLRKDLIEKGHRFKTKTDTEVLIHLYEEYGTDFLKYFDGMFAFSLWDSRQKRLILARDRFGIKPLFYTTGLSSGRLAFSSEIRPLLKMPGLSKKLDPIAIDQFFALSYILHPRSVYKNIKKLSPGCFLLIKGSDIQEVKYWDLPASRPAESPKIIWEQLDEAISDSVKTMMHCDVPYGAFLSGGLDSGTIVYHMTKHSLKPIQTFSIRYNEKSFDEGLEASIISKYLGSDHHEIWVRPEHILQLQCLTEHFGEPFADPALIPTFLLSQLAREKVIVALSGDGGDEILGGYQTYIASNLTNFFSRLPKFFIDFLFSSANQLPTSMKRLSFDYKLKKFFAGCHLPPLEHHVAWKQIFSADDRKKLFTKDFCKQINESIDKPVFNQWNHLFQKNGLSQLTKYQYLDIKTFLADNNLSRVDRMSMANSLEVRIPFLDMNVVETAFKLDPYDRIRGFNTKVFLRKTMKNRLPSKILKMKKKGFAVPLSFWFRGPLREFVMESLSSERIKATGILRHEIVSEIISKHLSGRENLNRPIWNLICFLFWYEDYQANVSL